LNEEVQEYFKRVQGQHEKSEKAVKDTLRREFLIRRENHRQKKLAQ